MLRARSLMVLAVLVAMAPGGRLGAEEISFSRFRVLLANGKRVEGAKGRLTPTNLEATSRSGEAIDVPRGQIRALDVARGSHAAKGAAIGGASGLLTGLLAIAQVGLDEDMVLDEGKAVGVTAGLTVGGALIGAAIGGGYKRWEPVALETAAWAPRGLQFAVLHLRF